MEKDHVMTGVRNNLSGDLVIHLDAGAGPCMRLFLSFRFRLSSISYLVLGLFDLFHRGREHDRLVSWAIPMYFICYQTRICIEFQGLGPQS